MNGVLREIAEVRARAQCLYTRAEVDAAFDRMAGEITEALGDADPRLLAILVGGMYPAV